MPGPETPLSAHGLAAARALGRSLAAAGTFDSGAVVLSSPLVRCVATADALSGGAFPAEPSPLLGAPGAFVLGNGDETPLTAADLRAHALGAGECHPALRGRAEGASLLVRGLAARREGDAVVLAVSHDHIVACVIAELGAGASAEVWPEFLHGVVIYGVAT